MNRRMMFLVSAPTVLIGMVLFVACLTSSWYMDRMHGNLTSILASNVASMQSAQTLEMSVRQLRFHTFLYLIDPDPSLLSEINRDDELFQEGLKQAERVASTEQEQETVLAIRAAYEKYQRALEGLREDVEKNGPRRDVRRLAAAHPILDVVAACRKYAKLNEDMMIATSRECANLNRTHHVALLLVGFGGPLGGLLAGYGIARGLQRSLYRLSVHVQDAAQQLDKHVAAVEVRADDDLERLDTQLRQVVSGVSEVVARVQQQQHDMYRAQQLAAVGQLAAGVAHEIRNPLTSIKLLVEAGLRRNKPKPLNADQLQVVHHEIRRLEQVVQNFLDFARPPSLRPDACDLRDVIQRAADLVRVRAKQQQVALEVAVPDRPCVAMVDRNQVCSVLVNLFINALDAMPHGGRLAVTLQNGDAWSWRMTVTDTGPGISAAVLDKLFTPFQSTKPTGSGLGLSICRRIVEDHGGEIEGENDPRGGARFKVMLPQGSVHAPNIAHH